MIMGAGHTFVILLKDAFPINVLHAIKACSEVCHIFCATANPLEVMWPKRTRAGASWAWLTDSRPKVLKPRGRKSQEGIPAENRI